MSFNKKTNKCEVSFVAMFVLKKNDFVLLRMSTNAIATESAHKAVSTPKAATTALALQSFD
jgi:hypothetical protein